MSQQFNPILQSLYLRIVNSVLQLNMLRCTFYFGAGGSVVVTALYMELALSYLLPYSNGSSKDGDER